MTKLTYKIVDEKNITLMNGILTLAEAKDTARRYGAKYIAEYTTVREKTHFDRSKCKISEEWLARHAH